jgi:collagenase-like PrtC family protease
MGYVKNITAHYRLLLDEILERAPNCNARSSGAAPSTSARPERNFNRGSTDYFVKGRKEDIGAFESPKHLGLAHWRSGQSGRQVV